MKAGAGLSPCGTPGVAPAVRRIRKSRDHRLAIAAGAERVAIVQATRDARGCALCAERKANLSPFAQTSTAAHANTTTLPAAAVEAVHRIVTDAARLTRGWLEELLTDDFTAG